MSTPLGLLPDFPSFVTHHAVTGAMRHVLRHGGLDVGEEMLLGLGAGAGFFYRHPRGATPMLLGQGNTRRANTPGLVVDAGRRLGVRVEPFSGGGARRAEASMREELEAGRPVMARVDIGLMPYFDFPEEHHFGGHMVVVAGDRDDHMWVVDRDDDIHLVPVEALMAARGSTHEPFPPKHAWYRLDPSEARLPGVEDIRGAVRQNARAMLDGPVSNMGVKGIRKAARLVPRWSTMLTESELRHACRTNLLAIDARGGTGGGFFRAMYGRFLDEAAEVTGAGILTDAAGMAEESAERWDVVGKLFEAAYGGEVSADVMGEVGARLAEIADAEQALWVLLYAWSE